MKRILVWDVPTRGFHWLLTLTVGGAWVLAHAAGRRDVLFQVHMILGLIAVVPVLFRLLWGVFGSRHVRFGSFAFGPGSLVRYLRDALRREDQPHIGHNPGSAYAAYAMLALTAGLVVTGVLLPTQHGLGEVHEVLSHLILLVVAVHLLGLVRHSLRHRDGIALSMFHGKKPGDPAQAIRSSHAVVGAVVVLVSAAWAVLLFANHDATARQLNLFGQTVRLGGTGHGERGHHDERDERGEQEHGERD